MTRVTLSLKAASALRVDLRGVLPAPLAALSPAQIERVPVTHGNQTLALAELFTVAVDGSPGAAGADEIRLVGDCARIDRIGWLLAAGRIVVEGAAGDCVGGGMSGGDLLVRGSAGLMAAVEMAGGRLTIDGDVGDHAASILPGSIDGMRGGTLVVRGRAGARFADRMRRGTAVVFGDAGDFLASRLVAGTVAIGGRAGLHAGFGMRRGSVVFAGAAPAQPPTFVAAQAEAPVIWQLMARDLASHGGPFAGLAARRPQRLLGDVAADGKGELVVFAG